MILPCYHLIIDSKSLDEEVRNKLQIIFNSLAPSLNYLQRDPGIVRKIMYLGRLYLGKTKRLFTLGEMSLPVQVLILLIHSV